MVRSPLFQPGPRTRQTISMVTQESQLGAQALHLIEQIEQGLDPGHVNQGGACLLSDDIAAAAEVIDGHGPGSVLDFRDRKKAAQAAGGDDE